MMISICKYSYYLKIYDSNNTEILSQLYNSTNSTYSESYNISSNQLNLGNYTIKIINYMDDKVMSTAKLTVKSARYPDYNDYSVSVPDTIIKSLCGGIINMSISPTLGFTYKYCYYLKIFEGQSEVISKLYNSTDSAYSEIYNITPGMLSSRIYTMKIINYYDGKVMDSANLHIKQYISYWDYSVSISDTIIDYGENGTILMNISPASGYQYTYSYILKIYDSKGRLESSRSYSNTQPAYSEVYNIKPNKFNAGNYTVKIINYDDNRVMDTAILRVNKIPTKLISFDVTTNYKDNNYLVATLKDQNGNLLIGRKLDIDFNGVKSFTTDSNGQINISTKDLPPKTYIVTIKFKESNNYYKSNTIAKVVVNKINVSLFSTDINVIYNDDSYFVTTLRDHDGNPIEGVNVSINLDCMKTFSTDSNGQINISTRGLAPKTYIATISFEGNDYYENYSTSAKVVINKAETSLISVNLDTVYSSNKYLIATLKDNQNNPLSDVQLNIVLNNKTHSLTTDFNGQVKLSTADLVPKNYTAIITFDGNNKYKESTTTAKITINKANSQIIVDKLIGIWGHDLTLTAKVSSNDLIINEGIVSFYEGKINIGEAKVNNGIASLTYTPVTTGEHIISVIFNSNNYLSSNNVTKVFVEKALTNILASAVSTVYNGDEYLVITLKDVNGKPVSGATVTVVLGGKTYTPNTDKNGQVKISTNGLKPVNKYTATITFDGNDNYAKSNITVKVTVKKATPKLTAKAKTFKKSVKTKKYTVTLKTNLNKVMKNTKVTIKVNKKTYSAKTNSKGVATFKITKLTKKGKYTATVTYKGSSYYNKLTKKVKITIK